MEFSVADHTGRSFLDWEIHPEENLKTETQNELSVVGHFYKSNQPNGA